MAQMHQQFAADSRFQIVNPQVTPGIGWFDFAVEREGSLMRGRQLIVFKVLPPNLSFEHAQHLRMQRQELIAAKSSFMKLLQEFVAFVYVTDTVVHQQVLPYLANFHGVDKALEANLNQMFFLLDTSNGYYLMPQDLGFVGVLPLKKLRDQVKNEILEPFRVWRQGV